MASAAAVEKMCEARENAEFVVSAAYRRTDKPARKCPKCGSVYFAKVGIDNSNGMFADPHIVVYCAECKTVYESEEVGFE